MSSKSVKLKLLLVLVIVAALLAALSSCTLPGGSNGGSWDVSGFVIQPNGQPVTAASVKAGSISTITDSSGNYTLSGLSDGSYSVLVSKSGYVFTPSSESVTVAGADVKNVGFQGTPGSAGTYSISGQITLNGSGMLGVSVSVGALTTATDSGGFFTLSGLGDGSYTVTATLDGFTFSPSSRSEQVSGNNISSVNFTATTVNGLPAPGTPPEPVSYGQTESETPQTSTPVLVAAHPLAVEFSPKVTAAILTNGTGLNLGIDPCLDSKAVELIDPTGAIVNSPVVPFLPGLTIDCSVTSLAPVKPLSHPPVLEVWEYWQLVDFNKFPQAGTWGSSTTVTSGISQTQATNFTYTVGASFTASGKTPFGGVSATISANVSSSASNSMTISNSTSTKKTFSITIPSGKEGVETVWQLVYQLRLAQQATSAQISAGQADSFGYVPFSDPANFTFLGSLPTVTIEQAGDILPQVTLFAAP